MSSLLRWSIWEAEVSKVYRDASVEQWAHRCNMNERDALIPSANNKIVP